MILFLLDETETEESRAQKIDNRGYLFDAALLDRNEDSASKHRESGAQLDQVCPATALDAVCAIFGLGNMRMHDHHHRFINSADKTSAARLILYYHAKKGFPDLCCIVKSLAPNSELEDAVFRYSTFRKHRSVIIQESGPVEAHDS